MMQSLSPVVKNLIIINVLVYFGTMMWEPRVPIEYYPDIESFLDLGRYSLTAFMPTSKYFYPVQVVSNMFMHAGLGHLFFNMLSLFFFGSLVEASMGSKRFFIFYLVCGFGALLVYWAAGFLMGNISPAVPVLGASGAIYGVLVAHAYIEPNRVVYLLIPPIPLKMKYLVVGMIALDIFGGISNAASGTAHFAHLGGGLLGLLLTVYWSRTTGLYKG